MFELIAKLLTAGLSLWDDKEKNKYTDRLHDLERQYYEEYNKPRGKRSNARLDQLNFQLRVLGDSFVSSVGAKRA